MLCSVDPIKNCNLSPSLTLAVYICIVLTSTLWSSPLPSLVCAVPQPLPYDGVALAAGVEDRARAQAGHLAVHGALWLPAVRDFSPLEGLDLAQPEVLIVHPVISDVDKLAQLPGPVVAGELDLLLVESPLELGAGLVLRRVPVQDLHHEDGELLVGPGAHGHPDPVDHRVILQLNLQLLSPQVNKERAGNSICFCCNLLRMFFTSLLIL